MGGVSRRYRGVQPGPEGRGGRGPGQEPRNEEVGTLVEEREPGTLHRASGPGRILAWRRTTRLALAFAFWEELAAWGGGRGYGIGTGWPIRGRFALTPRPAQQCAPGASRARPGYYPHPRVVRAESRAPEILTKRRCVPTVETNILDSVSWTQPRPR